MKTLSKLLLLLFIGIAIFYSCEDDTFTEQDAIDAIHKYDSTDNVMNDEDVLVADSLNTNWVVLTIKVVNASGDFSGKGYQGATVTISKDGETVSNTTTSEGSASFSGLKPGIYAVNITSTGFTTVDFTTETNGNGYYSVQVPILSTTSNLMAIEGKVTCETNLLNTSREAAANVTVLVQPNLPDFYNIPGITEIAYSGYTNKATTDANGNYSLNVPADMAGDLKYDIAVPTFEASQTLMLEELDGVDITGAGNAAQTVTTRFGTELAGSESAVPAVNPIYCVFSTPTHTLTPATLTVELDDYNTGVVDKAYVTSAGANYGPNNPSVTINNSNPDGADAYITLVTDNSTGQIQYITVTGGGHDFTSIPNVDLSFEQDDAEITVDAVDANGAITGYTITDGGEFLTDQLTVTGGDGSGATYNISWNGSNYYISGINNGGSGYSVNDNLSVGVPTTVATASVTMGTSKVSSVQVTNQGEGYEPSTTYNVKFSYGDAAATAYTDDYGRVYRVIVTNSSYNYTTPPTATVDYNLINKTATAKVFVQDGEVKSLFNLDGGAGYDNLPTITFYSQYESGNPAISVDYDVTVNGSDPYNVATITINNSPKNIKKNISTKTGNGPKNNVKSVPGETIYEDFYLGTGVRTNGN